MGFIWTVSPAILKPVTTAVDTQALSLGRERMTLQWGRCHVVKFKSVV